MSNLSRDDIKNFILEHLKSSFEDNGISIESIQKDFDLMKMGIIDSLGFIQLIGAIEEHFNIEIDFEELDADQLTVIETLCNYIAEKALYKNS